MLGFFQVLDLTKQQKRAVAVLHAGSGDTKAPDQAQCVYKQMALAALYLLTGVVAYGFCGVAVAPFSLLLTLWLSSKSTDGVVFLSAFWRTWWRRA